MTSASPSPPTRPLRLRLRFTLRRLFATLTLLCLLLGLWTHRAREQHRLVERITESGGVVGYEVAFGPYRRPVNIFSPSPVPHLLLVAVGEDFFYHVNSVHLYQGSDDRQLFRRIATISGIAEIHAYTDELTDDDVYALSTCSSLKSLCLSCSKGNTSGLNIGDRSLELVGKLPSISSVSIDGTNISQQGLAALANSKSLVSVSIRGCNRDVKASVANLFDKDHVKTLDIWKTIGPEDAEPVAWWHAPQWTP